MCWLEHEILRCLACNDRPQCRRKRRVGDDPGIKACDAQIRGIPEECPNGGVPDPNWPLDNIDKEVGTYQCQACHECIRRAQARARSAW